MSAKAALGMHCAACQPSAPERYRVCRLTCVSSACKRLSSQRKVRLFRDLSARTGADSLLSRLRACTADVSTCGPASEHWQALVAFGL